MRIIFSSDKLITWNRMHPEGFIMNQSGGTSFQEFGDRKAEYRFNKQRLRGGELDSNKVNVLALGDSFTFGLLLDESDTYISLLQDKADKEFPDSLQFLNGGIGGSGMGDWPGWLEEYGSGLEVDYLVYFMNNNDIERALSKNLHVFDPSKQDSLEKSQRWKPKPIMPYLSNKEWYRSMQRYSKMVNIFESLLWKNVYFTDLTSDFDSAKTEVRIPGVESFSEDSDYSIQVGNAILNKMDKWCSRKGCEFIVITTGYYEIETMSIWDKKFYEWYSTTAVPENENYFDNKACVEDKIISSLDEIRIPGDSHPNEEGAQIIANCTWEKLITTFENN